MTVAVVVIFAGCIVAGMGLTHLNGLAMRTEERFFAGWILGIVGFTLSGLFTTRLFTFGGPAVALALALILALSVPGWRRSSDTWSNEIADLKDRLTKPLKSGENPILLAVILIPVWVLVARLFANAYTINDDGSIMVGHLASFSDWQAHLTYTASFAYAENTGLKLPLASGYDLGYHAGMNLFSALLIPAGTSLPGSLELGGAFTLFAFPGAMYCAGMRVFKDQAVALLGTALFLFFGGWGWIEFFRDVSHSQVDVWPRLPRTYTRLPELEILRPGQEPGQGSTGKLWMENPIVGHFFPQRPTLIGFPLVLMVLSWLHTAWNTTDETTPRTGMRPFLFCGLLVGLVPFFNLFAFGVPLGFAGLWWLLTRFDRRWLWFLVPAAILAYPMVRYMQPPSSHLEIPYDWVAHVTQANSPGGAYPLANHIDDWILFWARNMGLFIPLLLIAQAISIFGTNMAGQAPDGDPGGRPGRFRVMSRQSAIATLPVWLLFIVANAIKPHPWNGNNTHYFVFLLLIGAFPVAALLINTVRRLPAATVVALPVLLTMTLAGALDVIATNERVAHPYPVTAMDSGGVAVGMWARTTDPDAVFVIESGWPGGYASIHQHPVPALSGRDVVLASDGWVYDLGIPDWPQRKDHMRLILEAAPGWQQLVDLYEVDYLVVGAPTPGWDPNHEFWEANADVVYRHAGWTVYEL